MKPLKGQLAWSWSQTVLDCRREDNWFQLTNTQPWLYQKTSPIYFCTIDFKAGTWSGRRQMWGSTQDGYAFSFLSTDQPTLSGGQKHVSPLKNLCDRFPNLIQKFLPLSLSSSKLFGIIPLRYKSHPKQGIQKNSSVPI